MTNEKLVAAVQAGDNVSENLLALWNQNMGLLRRYVWRYLPETERADGLQELFFALHKAAYSFDPAAGAAFTTYLGFHLRAALFRYLQESRLVRLPSYQTARLLKVRRIAAIHQQQTGETADLKTLAELTGLSMRELDTLRQINGAGKPPKSIDSPIAADEAGELTLSEMIPAQGDLEEQISNYQQQKQLSDLLWKLVEEADESALSVGIRRWKNGESIARIAEQTGATPAQVQQAERKLLHLLRNPQYNKALRPFLPDALGTKPYHSGVQSFKYTNTSSGPPPTQTG